MTPNVILLMVSKLYLERMSYLKLSQEDAETIQWVTNDFKVSCL